MVWSPGGSPVESLFHYENVSVLDQSVLLTAHKK